MRRRNVLIVVIIIVEIPESIFQLRALRRCGRRKRPIARCAIDLCVPSCCGRRPVAKRHDGALGIGAGAGQELGAKVVLMQQ
jgi:hypothetical protein